MDTQIKLESLKCAVKIAIVGLKFYADQTYSYTHGLDPKVQWIAEDCLDTIDKLVGDILNEDK